MGYGITTFKAWGFDEARLVRCPGNGIAASDRQDEAMFGPGYSHILLSKDMVCIGDGGRRRQANGRFIPGYVTAAFGFGAISEGHMVTEA
ncbi:uncharacterized protein CTRU02_208676 [Colletotrichum truncatum]|uniref:Uncharacterized protein n=1 Tax=Colletotrichum truncatum TaxID=5467 RepID=A0ACC3YX37_COLTU